jgi:hypothetical protein
MGPGYGYRGGYRDWREEARQKREAQLTFIRQMASGSKKRLPRSQRMCIMEASKQGS